jgi:hypothetical protein
MAIEQAGGLGLGLIGRLGMSAQTRNAYVDR